TIGGARAIHLDAEIGSGEPRKRADIIIVGMDNAHQIPLFKVFLQLVYATKASDVQTSIIDRRIRMENRRVMTLGKRAIRLNANQYRDRIRKSLASPNPTQ